jgi:CheY-like chemotaxis protein
MATATRVLVVEDSLGARILLSRVLSRAGYDVVEAADASEALRLLQEHRFDVMVSDVQMPGMSGLELVRRVRQRGSLSHLRVIINTSLVQERVRREAFNAGADAYFTKHGPGSLEPLLATVGQLSGCPRESPC